MPNYEVSRDDPEFELDDIEELESQEEVGEKVNSARKGSDFEETARSRIMGEGVQHLSFRVEDNGHLDTIADGIGISNTERRIGDYYVDLGDDGEIWEFKAGYETNHVDQKQALDYSYMAEAGKVNVRGDDGEVIEKKVGSVNYLFSTQKGAENNEFIQDYATLWFMDENGDIQLYEGKEEN
ncbi:MAG: hypothetical protein H6657_09295 [Ardenticatenaceae bacterium]|nr:hypothetical protein [Ardenticatenaceae bacterium]